MGQLLIGQPRVEQTEHGTRWSVEVAGPDLPNELWFEVDGADYADVTTRVDPALVVLVMPAMKRSLGLRWRGEATDHLVDQLAQDFQSVVERIEPGLSRVSLSGESSPVRAGGEGVLTGFSAGVDSFTVLADYFFGEAAKGLQVTHLVSTNGDSANGRQLWTARTDLAQPAADEMGLPLLRVDSNLGDFYPGWVVTKNHTPRNVAIAHLLSPLCGIFYYASSYHYEHVRVAHTYDISFADPVILPLLSTPGTWARSAGGSYTRIDRIVKIAELSVAQRFLNVCVVDSARNCSVCWKCKRTLLTLEAAGRLEDFSSVFDLSAWSRVRAGYLREVHEWLPFDAQVSDLIRFARDRGVRFPLRATVVGWSRGTVRSTARNGRKAAGHLLRKVGLR